MENDDKVRYDLEQEFGQVWDTPQVKLDYEVLGFLAPFVLVRRRSDGVRGLLQFQHSPRFYFDFKFQMPGCDA